MTVPEIASKRSRRGPRERAGAALGRFGWGFDAREQCGPTPGIGLRGAACFFFGLALADVRFELRLLGRGEVFELGDLARDALTLAARDRHERFALRRERGARVLRLLRAIACGLEFVALTLELRAREGDGALGVTALANGSAKSLKEVDESRTLM